METTYFGETHVRAIIMQNVESYDSALSVNAIER